MYEPYHFRYASYTPPPATLSLMTTRPIVKPLAVSEQDWDRLRAYVETKAPQLPTAPTVACGGDNNTSARGLRAEVLLWSAV